MKYMLLIYSNPQIHQQISADIDRIMAEVDEIMKELTESGEWVDGNGLADPLNTKVVKLRDGVPVVTDGPFAEAKEQLAGYCVIDCETEERALEIAARWPDARYQGIELRPMMDGSGTEM
jgi:hypothetical protein